MSATAAVFWSLPWVVPTIVGLVRFRRSRSLDDVNADVAPPIPLVSVVVPARNERRNIERCVTSLAASTYPALEIIVVDDHSTDGTGDIARQLGAHDDRIQVISAPELPPDWFGKQWACTTGARAARGELLLFTDADTRHGPDLLSRAVNALRDNRADLLTLAGHQEMHSFWERVIQPQVFGILFMRYGGTEHVSNAKRAEDVIANGQFILVRREAYDAVGGHAVVRHRVAEDLALAQEFFRAHRRVLLMLALHQFSTHMYAGLGELIEGWRKNMFVGGRNAAVGGAVGRMLFPVALVGFPVFSLLPAVVLPLAVAGILSTGWLIWALLIVTVSVAVWIGTYRFMRERVWYALLYPVGLAMVLYIAVGAVIRGNRVTWKGPDVPFGLSTVRLRGPLVPAAAML